MATVSLDRLKRVVDRALRDDAYAEVLFNNPDAVAREYGLGDDERLVIEQMNRKQFETARQDAAKRVGVESELSDHDLATVVGGSTTSTVTGTTTDMIVGRSISSATGSYPSVSADCGCCAWKGGISAGGSVILPS
jgi:hypothetical protein